MNITFLIGNGFDINLGLKTRYIDFYRYYTAQSRENDTDSIKEFKSEITKFIQNDTQKGEDAIDWRDLEVALGKWTAKMKEEDVESLYLNLNDNLKAYLIDEFKTFDPKAFDAQKFIHCLLDPVTGNFNRDRTNDLKAYWSGFPGPDYLNIINFNYTHTIERLSGFKGGPMELGANFGRHATVLSNIYHIHQTLDDEEILVGLNDVSQIANKDFHNNRHICNLLVKPMTNALLGSGVNQDCEEIIASTNLFVIFGSSTGITDKKWWKAVFDRIQTANARLLLFVFGQKRPHMNLALDDMSEVAIRSFLASAGIKDEAVLSSVLSNSYVFFKGGMFNLPVTYNNLIADTQTYKIAKSEATIKVLDRGMKYLTLSVDAPNEETGVAAEHMWIKEFFPKHKQVLQSINAHKVGDVELPFDRIIIASEDNIKDLFFEISSYFGNSGIMMNNVPPEQRAVSFVKKVRQSFT